jgi:hypothetical protein
MDGLAEAERQRFVDILLVIKANLVRINGNGNGNGNGSWARAATASHEGADDGASVAGA